ncbi:MAG: hypothetical protein MK108_01340 [Mariniblastus sp.]|nr:hypothetical protein [Mariniblastus sp.]
MNAEFFSAMDQLRGVKTVGTRNEPPSEFDQACNGSSGQTGLALLFSEGNLPPEPTGCLGKSGVMGRSTKTVRKPEQKLLEFEQCVIFYNIMNIEFQCDCGESLTALGHQVGELIDCPTCSKLVQVPPRPGKGILQQAEKEDEAFAAVEHRGKPRISRAPTCKRCKTRLVPTAIKESNPFGNILGRSIFAVGVVMALLGLIFSNVFPVVFGLCLTVGGVLVVMLLRETKMSLNCPKCQPVVKSRKMLKAS